MHRRGEFIYFVYLFSIIAKETAHEGRDRIKVNIYTLVVIGLALWEVMLATSGLRRKSWVTARPPLAHLIRNPFSTFPETFGPDQLRLGHHIRSSSHTSRNVCDSIISFFLRSQWNVQSWIRDPAPKIQVAWNFNFSDLNTGEFATRRKCYNIEMPLFRRRCCQPS